MNLTHRKPRPLIRDSASLRDDRLFFVGCDDTYAPKQYFDFFRIPRIQVYVVPTLDGTSAAKHVLDRLQQFELEDDDEFWMLLDTDHYTERQHIGSFIQALRHAFKKNINVALSKPCFELWLLLHHQDETTVASLRSASDVERALQERLGQYNKTNLKREHFPINTVADACERAARLDSGTKGGEIPETNTTRVYLLWNALISKALPSQLPEELKTLLNKE
jgi:hypothetical protein